MRSHTRENFFRSNAKLAETDAQTMRAFVEELLAIISVAFCAQPNVVRESCAQRRNLGIPPEGEARRFL